MVLGIGLFGILTASLSSFFVAQAHEPVVDRIQAEIVALREEVAALGRRLPPSAQASPPKSLD
jgi:hypothetical protein